MANKRSSLFTSFVLVISDVSVIASVYWVLGSVNSYAFPGIGFIPWLCFTAAALPLYRLFMRRGRTLPQAAAFLSGLYVIMSAVLLAFFAPQRESLSYLTAVMIWAAPFWHIYSMTEKAPALGKLVGRLEALIAALLIMLIYTAAAGKPYILIIPSAVSVLLCIAVIVIERTTGGMTGESRGIRGASVILSMAVFFIAAAGAFLLFASLPIGSAVKSAAQAVLDGLKFLLDQFLKFCEWLLSLLPHPADLETGPLTSYPPGISGGEEEAGNSNPFISVNILIVIGALALILIVFALIKFRRKRLSGTNSKNARPTKKHRRAAPAYLRRIWESVRFFAAAMIYRNTPQGVLIHLERWGRMHRKGRLAGETHRQYLKRLAGDKPERAGALDRLSDALDSRYYSSSKSYDMPKRELAALRRRFAL